MKMEVTETATGSGQWLCKQMWCLFPACPGLWPLLILFAVRHRSIPHLAGINITQAPGSQSPRQEVSLTSPVQLGASRVQANIPGLPGRVQGTWKGKMQGQRDRAALA